jgi:hypothetical protein
MAEQAQQDKLNEQGELFAIDLVVSHPRTSEELSCVTRAIAEAAVGKDPYAAYNQRHEQLADSDNNPWGIKQPTEPEPIPVTRRRPEPKKGHRGVRRNGQHPNYHDDPREEVGEILDGPAMTTAELKEIEDGTGLLAVRIASANIEMDIAAKEAMGNISRQLAIQRARSLKQ